MRGLRLVVAGDGFGALSALGAEVIRLESGLGEEAVSALVCDTRARFAHQGLQAALASAWAEVRAVAVGALIPSGGGKVVLIAPPPDSGELASAMRAALENLARTLSVEWARYGIRVTALAPGPSTTERELEDLVSFVLSRAGDYFSGCRFDLGAV